ncbi:phiSA1p31-related protein [Streptomyces sp. NPDC048272]|uniref:phiSA1p31-related protein n=1 Tax=Streptomyces sp. NPDC048272 TaxID=3154616 RepID=UPI00342DB78E
MSVTVLTAPELLRLLARVTPHMSDDDTIPVLSAVHLEAINGCLYASATDRFTMAAARVAIVTEGEWAGPIPATETDSVMKWLRGEGKSAVRVTITTDGDYFELVLASASDEMRVLCDKRSYGNPPNWRTLIRAQLDAEPELVPVTGFTTEFLARWQYADTVLIGWQSAPHRALVLMSDDASFIGVQMPVRTEQTRAELAAKWENALSPLAYVDGQSYRLDVQWTDADGDPWEYTGRTRNGQPLMRLAGLEDAEVSLAELVAEHSPLLPVRAA